MTRRPSGELAPSIVSADLARFGEQLAAVEPHSGRWHVDVMDGHYVPNLTIGPSTVGTIARISKLPQDVHLMIANPDATWRWYSDAGASRIAFHPATSSDPAALITTMREAGVGPGVAINPDEPAEEIDELLAGVDHVVVMTVRPGFSGQAFIADVMPKLRTLRSWVDERRLDVQLVVDGGINRETAPLAVEAGADVLVSASAVFGSEDPPAMARELASSWTVIPGAAAQPT
ncbi:MAG TPA: ribulose-phosphate 3-epimerase [Actinomycetota bacterium]|nr:ribulose-phosphate 3-epimerase [Actinomycetota bacterium]